MELRECSPSGLFQGLRLRLRNAVWMCELRFLYRHLRKGEREPKMQAAWVAQTTLVIKEAYKALFPVGLLLWLGLRLLLLLSSLLLLAALSSVCCRLRAR